MKLTKILQLALFTGALSIATACCDKKPDEPVMPGPLEVTGNWLLSSASPTSWVTYDFLSNGNVESVIYSNTFENPGSGFYFTKEETKGVTATISYQDGTNRYVDWIVKSAYKNQINIEIYDNNLSSGQYSLYRILAKLDVTAGQPSQVDYASYTGNNKSSNFRSVNPEVLTVDSKSGELMGVREGKTFVVFDTSDGTAAIQVEVTGTSLPLQEFILGSWVSYEGENYWEIESYEFNGYYSSIYTVTGTNIEIAQGRYTLDDTNNVITITQDINGTTMTGELRILSREEYSFEVATYAENNSFAGNHLCMKVVDNISMSPSEAYSLNLASLVNKAQIKSYKSLNEKVVSIDETGKLTANNPGYGFIQITTDRGSAVVVVNVEGGLIPIDFEKCLDATPQEIFSILGDNPYIVTDTMISYSNYNENISMLACSLNAWSGVAIGVVIVYNDDVNSNEILNSLEHSYQPYANGTTDTVKAFINTSEISTATVGVTWNKETNTLTYLRLPTELFRDYGLLLEMTRSEVENKMEAKPSISLDNSYGYANPEKNVEFLLIAFDGSNTSDRSWGVVIDLDSSLTEDQMKSYFNRLYTFRPTESTQTYYTYLSKNEKVLVMYDWTENSVTYLTADDYVSRSGKSLAEIKARLLEKSK